MRTCNMVRIHGFMMETIMQTWQHPRSEAYIRSMPYGTDHDMQKLAQVADTDADTVAILTVIWLMTNS